MPRAPCRRKRLLSPLRTPSYVGRRPHHQELSLNAILLNDCLSPFSTPKLHWPTTNPLPPWPAPTASKAPSTKAPPPAASRPSTASPPTSPNRPPARQRASSSSSPTPWAGNSTTTASSPTPTLNGSMRASTSPSSWPGVPRPWRYWIVWTRSCRRKCRFLGRCEF